MSAIEVATAILVLGTLGGVWALCWCVDQVARTNLHILKRLREIEDTRPVNKIELRSDPAVPPGQMYCLDDSDLKRWK